MKGSIRTGLALLTIGLAACSPPAPAEPAKAQDTRQQLLAWVAALSAQTGQLDNATSQRILNLSLHKKEDLWVGSRPLGLGTLSILVEHQRDGTSADIGIPAMGTPEKCILAMSDLVTFARAHGYEARFSNIPGRKHFWILEAPITHGSLGLFVYGRPNMSNDTRDTACVAGLNATRKGARDG